MKVNVTVSAKLGNYETDCQIEIGSDEYMKEHIFEALQKEYPEIEEDEQVSADNISYEVTDWEDLDDYKELKDESLFEELADYSGSNDLEILNAGNEAGVSFSDIDEAYSGTYKDDEAFTEDLLEQTGDLPSDLPAYIHIDWESTARDIMMDYSEANGHYFRNL